MSSFVLLSLSFLLPSSLSLPSCPPADSCAPSLLAADYLVGRPRGSSASRKKKKKKLKLQASKVLSMERDLVSATGRLDAAVAAREDAVRSRGDAEVARRAAEAVLDELAELIFEALPQPPLPPPPPSVSQPPGRGGKGKGEEEGGGEGRGASAAAPAEACGGGGRGGALEGLAGLEARLQDCGGADGAEVGDRGAQDEAGLGGGGGDPCLEGRGQLRRAVRAVMTLVEAGARATADRDRAANEVCISSFLDFVSPSHNSREGGKGRSSITGGSQSSWTPQAIKQAWLLALASRVFAFCRCREAGSAIVPQPLVEHGRLL